MSKKDKPKSKQGEDGKSAKTDDTTALLQIPQGLYNTYLSLFNTDQKRNKFWRKLYDLVDDDDTTVYSLEHCNVTSKENVTVKSADADDDGDEDDDCGKEPKLCDEGGGGP